MALTLPRIAGRMFGQPLMLSPQKLEITTKVLEPRLTGQMKFFFDDDEDDAPPPKTSLMEKHGRVGVITLDGSLCQRGSYADADCGLISYQCITDTLQQAMQDDMIDAVLFDIDSGGGEVAGNFDLVDQIFALRGVKPIWAIANEACFSAAYSIASACERVVMTRTANVGSIGVVAAHIDQSQYDAELGLKWSLIFAGNHKVDGNPHEPLSEDGRSEIQNSVDRCYRLFTETVARNRGISIAAVVDTQARIFSADDAISLGLADAVMTLDEAIAALAIRQQNQSIHTLKTRKDHTMNDTTPENSLADSSTPAVAASIPLTATPVAASPVPLLSAGDVIGLLNTAAQAGVPKNVAEDLISKGTSVVAIKTAMLDYVAEKASTRSVISANVAASTEMSDRSKMSLEERAKAEYAESKELQAEFSSEKTYVAYCQGVEEGRFRIKSSRN